MNDNDEAWQEFDDFDFRSGFGSGFRPEFGHGHGFGGFGHSLGGFGHGFSGFGHEFGGFGHGFGFGYGLSDEEDYYDEDDDWY